MLEDFEWFDEGYDWGFAKKNLSKNIEGAAKVE